MIRISNVKMRCFVFFVVTILELGGEFVFGKGYNSDNCQKGVVFVKFKPETITEISQILTFQNVKHPKVKKYFKKIGFKTAQKVFKNTQPFDTTAIARTGEVVKKIDLSHWYTLIIDKNIKVPDILDSLRTLPGIEHVSPVTIYSPSVEPNDPYFDIQKGLRNGTTGRDIHATGAWDINIGRNDVKVAVIDGGVDYNHVDLDPGDRSRIVGGYDTGDDDSNPMDDLPEGDNKWGNHGTSVAGIIGAITNNSEGVAGIMWNTRIIPVKVATSGWGPFNWWPNTVLMKEILRKELIGLPVMAQILSISVWEAKAFLIGIECS